MEKDEHNQYLEGVQNREQYDRGNVARTERLAAWFALLFRCGCEQRSLGFINIIVLAPSRHVLGGSWCCPAAQVSSRVFHQQAMIGSAVCECEF